jgi:hypothetical protein
MNSKPPALPPVPTPLPRLWREFRILVLPWLAFVALALLVALLWRDVVSSPSVGVPVLEAPTRQAQEGWAIQAARGERPVHRAVSSLTNSSCDPYTMKD